jgi:hypothetical protein
MHEMQVPGRSHSTGNCRRTLRRRCGDCSNLRVKHVLAGWISLSQRQSAEHSLAELFEAAAVPFPRCVCRKQMALQRESLMAYRMRAQELATVTEARRELAAEVRDLAGLLDSQEPDHLALHDAWEVLLGLAEQAENLCVQFFSRHPEQEAWLIEKRPWLDPKLELIGKPQISAGDPPRSPRSRASRPRRKQKPAHASA